MGKRLTSESSTVARSHELPSQFQTKSLKSIVKVVLTLDRNLPFPSIHIYSMAYLTILYRYKEMRNIFFINKLIDIKLLLFNIHSDSQKID